MGRFLSLLSLVLGAALAAGGCDNVPEPDGSRIGGEITVFAASSLTEAVR